MGCIWLLFWLWGSMCFANFTNFPLKRSISTRDGEWYMFNMFPRIGANVDDPITLEKRAAATFAYYEAVDLAEMAYQQLDEEDHIFLRYFEVWDFSFVKDIYKSIAGALDGNPGFGSPDIQKAYFCEGSCIYTPLICEQNPATASITQNLVWPREKLSLPGLPADAAAISLCQPFFDLHLLVERECSDIFGDNDNILMQSQGSTLLHELTHWRTLNEKAADFELIIRQNKNLDSIIDYYRPHNSPLVNPENGYGPLSAHQLVGRTNSDSAANADNYQWYALSKFWQLKCPDKNGGQGWGTAVNNERPGPEVAGSNGGRCPDVYDAPLTDCSSNSNTDAC